MNNFGKEIEQDSNSYKPTVLSSTKKWQNIVGVNADGIFGSLTTTATKKWQASHGLVADGIVGPKTWTSAGINPPLQTLRQAGSKPTTTPVSTSTSTPVVVSTTSTPASQSSAPSIIPKFAGWSLWAGLGLLGAFIYTFIDEHNKKARNENSNSRTRFIK